MVRFRTAEGVCMVWAENVVQVRNASELQPFPGHKPDVIGLIEQDGKALPVLGTMGPAGRHVLLLGAGGRTFGVAVGEVLGIARVSDSDVGPPPAGSARELIAGVVKIDGGFELLLSAEELGGQLDVQVSPAEPAAPAAPESKASSPTTPPLGKLADELPLRLLLVEDNVVVQTMTKRMMRKFGYAIDIATTGAQAIEAMRQNRYDVVFMDIQMPEMDGLHTMNEIVRLWPDGRPRVVAMSAETADAERQRCLDAGMNDYVAKPVKEKDLAAILRKWGGARGVQATGGAA